QGCPPAGRTPGVIQDSLPSRPTPRIAGGAGLRHSRPASLPTRSTPVATRKTPIPGAPGRQGKTMQHQKLPPEVLEALDTEAWFRERLAEVAGIGPAAGAQSATRPSKEALFDEAIAWYLAQAATG